MRNGLFCILKFDLHLSLSLFLLLSLQSLLNQRFLARNFRWFYSALLAKFPDHNLVSRGIWMKFFGIRIVDEFNLTHSQSLGRRFEKNFVLGSVKRLSDKLQRNIFLILNILHVHSSLGEIGRIYLYRIGQKSSIE